MAEMALAWPQTAAFAAFSIIRSESPAELHASLGIPRAADISMQKLISAACKGVVVGRPVRTDSESADRATVDADKDVGKDAGEDGLMDADWSCLACS